MIKTSVIAVFIFVLSSLPFAHASEPLSQDTRMKLVKTLSGDLAPKSVLSSGSGLISAHNMMYKHTVTIYDSKTMELVSTVKDSVDLKSFGFSKYSGNYRGAPVEGAFSGLFGSAFLPRCPGSFPVNWFAASFSIVFVAISLLNLTPSSSAFPATLDNKSCNLMLWVFNSSFLRVGTYPFNRPSEVIVGSDLSLSKAVPPY